MPSIRAANATAEALSSAPVAQPTATSRVLEVRGLEVSFVRRGGHLRVVSNISIGMRAGERLALVGESGSGKSLTALAIMGLLPPGARVTAGEIHVNGRPVLGLDAAAWRRLRGAEVAMIFQDPMTSLNPVQRIGQQLVEAIRLHRRVSTAAARSTAVELLERVQIPAAAQRLYDYPHQLSGGMRQRVMIAMALANRPKLLIADEPTTALDVTTQLQVLALIQETCEADGTAVLLISHDLGMVGRFCDNVAIMYAGRIVETGATREVFRQPFHPYTVGLLASIPPLESDVDRLSSIAGEPADLRQLPPGCAFAPRCPLRQPRCDVERPELRSVGTDRLSACHYAERSASLMNGDLP
jgi:peptide/nickel transport system ATP-binding protein